MIPILIQNAALLISLSLLYGVFAPLRVKKPFTYKFIIGIWFGVIAIAGMMVPFEYGPGAIFDGRSIVLALAGLFGGSISSLVTVLIAGTYRILIGGDGIWAGLTTIVSSAAAGLYFRRLTGNRPEKINLLSLFGIGVAVHVLMLACQLLFPWPMGLTIIEKIWFPVLLIFPPAFVLMSLLLRSVERNRIAETRIREAESLFRTTFYSIGDGIITTDTGGAIQQMNPVAEEITGWREDEARGIHLDEVYQIYSEETGESLENPVRKVLNTGNVTGLTIDAVLISKDKRKIPISDSGAPIIDEKGRITGVVLVFRDKSGERRKQKMLEESEEKFRKLFENHSAVHLLIDPQTGKIDNGNHAAAIFYGWSIDELTNMNIQQINTLPEEAIKIEIENARTEKKTFFEFKHRTSSGNERDVEVFTSKVIIQGKEYLHTIVHDVTEKKKLFHELVEAKEKAEESDRLKSAFLANMSHEIRTPLNGIIGFTDLLTKNDNLSKQKKKKYSGIINRSTESLMQLINDILDISRLETNQVIIKPKPFDLNVMLNGLLTLYKEKIADKEKENIKFEMLSPGKKFQVAADENRLIQIFINLLDNALKFTAEGEIRFGLDKVENGKLYFVVTDTGIGIKRERQEMIFDRFAQAEDEIATLYGGTGLGLSIVRKLVKLMNGNISVESEPGKGAIFRFNIPFIPVDIKHDDVIKNNISPGEVNSLKILVIEDDPLSLDYFKELLNNKGFELISAITGREGLQIALKEKPDVILLDIRLPDINGLEIIQEIKSRHASIKIIVQSAFAMDSDKEKAFKAGCDDFIAKPVNANLLLEKIGTKL